MTKRSSGWLAMIASITLVSATLTACSHETPQSQASPQANKTPAGPVYHISAHGTKGHPVTISNIVHGAPEYTLEAASVIYATNLQRGRFKENLLIFYKGRTPRLTVTAPTAVVDEVTHDVALSGGVRATTVGGVSLTSDTMTYSEKSRLLTALGHVVALEPGGNMLTGSRAIADLDLQQIRLFGEGTK